VSTCDARIISYNRLLNVLKVAIKWLTYIKVATRAGVAKSIWRLATGSTVLISKPGAAEFSAPLWGP
jgi:hypothetical protein